MKNFKYYALQLNMGTKNPLQKNVVDFIEAEIYRQIFWDLSQWLLQPLQAWPKMHADQLSDPVTMTVDDVMSWTAAVVPVQRGRAL